MEKEQTFGYNYKWNFPYKYIHPRCGNNRVSGQPVKEAIVVLYYHESVSLTTCKRWGGVKMLTNLTEFRICNVHLSITIADIVIAADVDLQGVTDENLGIAIKTALLLQPIVAKIWRSTNGGGRQIVINHPGSFYDDLLKDWDRLYYVRPLIEVNTAFSDYMRQCRHLRDDLADKNMLVHADGYVYLIQAASGFYKIGRTANPKNRIRTFSVKLPFEVDYLCLIKTKNMYKLERELHKRYEKKRVRGEWFKLSPADVEYIKGLAK